MNNLVDNDRVCVVSSSPRPQISSVSVKADFLRPVCVPVVVEMPCLAGATAMPRCPISITVSQGPLGRRLCRVSFERVRHHGHANAGPFRFSALDWQLLNQHNLLQITVCEVIASSWQIDVIRESVGCIRSKVVRATLRREIWQYF